MSTQLLNASSPGICNRLLFEMVQLCKDQYISFLVQTVLCILYFEPVILSPLPPLHFSSVLDPAPLSSIHSTSSPPYIIVHSSLICPHLPSLDNSVTFTPGHKFCMIVHLQALNSSLTFSSHEHMQPPISILSSSSLKFYVK